ncbi:SPOR domain-containing protein [Paenibacillus macerans]|uniref:SPOR domain-containing protein n=1 Tax=Paenibacillus macerans TaxID=44252 RepID=UPI00203D9283|nr:SPOR domain-containing protein [Paenibacillus macerans]MCM3700371.1 SPOR domain-containing protein [Paenibacillus macerans]
MNKAKMTFRFDQNGREVRAISPDQGHEKNDAPAWRYAVELPAEDTPWKKEHEAEVVPVERPARYRAVEAAESWGDPFTDHTGMGLTVFPGGRAKGDLGDEADDFDKSGISHRPEEVVTDPYSVRDHDDDPWGPRFEDTPYYTRPPKSSGSGWKVAGSLTGAIVTGALFGYVVLSLFNQEMQLPLPGIGSPQQSAADQAASLPAMAEIGAEGETMEESIPQISFALPEQTYYFLQYGVFSTAQGVQLAQEELQASGLAAARDTVDEKRVYAGVSTDREQSKLLSGQLKAAGVHLILHEVALPATASAEFAGDRGTLEGYMAQSAELVHLLSTTSASLLSEADPQPLGGEAVKQLGRMHQSWTESAAAVRGKWPTALEPYAGEMEKAINGAVEALGEFNKSRAKTLLWEVQNEMMRFIMAEQIIIHGVNPGENR